MNILYASDDNYVSILGVSLISLLENNKKIKEINVFVISDGISKDNSLKINEIGKKYSRCISIIPMINVNEVLGVSLQVEKLWGLAAYARLFLSKLLPSDVKKIIYLDCDTMIRSSLENLWNVVLHDNVCAGVLDCLSCFKTVIGFRDSEYYYNSGVLVIDVEMWKKENIESKIAEYIIERKGRVVYADQSIINVVIRNRWELLPAKYNMMAPLFCYPYDCMALMNDYTNYYSREEIEGAVSNPNIIHFTNGSYVGRPWFENCSHPYRKEYLAYKEISPWCNEPLWVDRRSKFVIIKEQLLQRKNKYYLIVRCVQFIRNRFHITYKV